MFIFTKGFINPCCEMSVHLTNITCIAASTSKFMNNLSSENTWIRIFLRERLTQFISGENYFNFGIFAKFFTKFLNFVLCHFIIHSYERNIKISCFNIRYLIRGASCVGLINSILRYFFITLSIMQRGYWFLNRTCLWFFRSVSKLFQGLLILYIRSINVLIDKTMF